MVSVYENYRLYPMAVLGKATLMSAVERRESRGAHFRKDFPGEKSEFMKCSVAEFKDEKSGFILNRSQEKREAL